MTRPKGSKNKKTKEEGKAKVEAELKALEAENPGLTEKAINEGFRINKEGDITAPVNPKSYAILMSCSECYHSKEMHYGPKTDWCNTAHCHCSTWKQ